MNGVAIVDGRLADLRLMQEGPLKRAFDALAAPGEETRLVGGAVRDVALGLPHGDFDLATTAQPQDGMRRAREAGLPVAPTGLAHGTFTLIIDGCPIEVTTLREDIETDGRRAVVRFGRDFRADALRRDFTVNALSVTPDGVIYDYCGGLDDLQAGRVRFIGDARQRIREDYLRILRFFRFSARFGSGALDAGGLAAAIAERDGLDILSRERVRSEFLKLLVAPHADAVVEAIAEAGLLNPLLAGVADVNRFKRRIALEAARGEAADAIGRLAALSVNVRDDAERLRERLRLSNAEAARLEAFGWMFETYHGASAPPEMGELWALLFARGRNGAQDVLTAIELCAAAGDPARFLAAYRFISTATPPRMPFSGDDLVARGVGPGQRLGAMLKKLQASWIRAGFPREPEVLAHLLDEATRE